MPAVRTTLTPAILSDLKKQLEEERIRISKVLSDEAEEFKEMSDDEEPGVSVVDEEDKASYREQRAELAAESEGMWAELRGIDAALRLFAAGTYGICVDCGKPISVERLRVLPGLFTVVIRIKAFAGFLAVHAARDKLLLKGRRHKSFRPPQSLVDRRRNGQVRVQPDQIHQLKRPHRHAADASASLIHGGAARP